MNKPFGTSLEHGVLLRYEKGTSNRESFMAVKHLTLAMKVVLHCTHIQYDMPSLRALAPILALRFETLSLSGSACRGTSSTEVCQV